MLCAVGILLLSAALLILYLRENCEGILRREFGGEFFHAVANASGLGFPSVCGALEESDEPVEYPRLLMRLHCDFLALAWLLKKACHPRGRFSHEERMLRMYFHAVYWAALGVGHGRGLMERAALLKLTSILEYFANVLGERQAWKVEIDVVVEESGTVFLVYPLSDVAREWLNTNAFKNAQRLGDIQFVEPRHLYGLAEAMLSNGLWVVWPPGFLIPKEDSAEVPREGTGSVSR